MSIDSTDNGSGRFRAFGLLLMLIPAALLISSCGGSEAESAGPPTGRAAHVIPTVEAVQARSGALPLEHRFSGTVRADNQVDIYSEISAPVVRVAVEDGDYVEAGAPLAYLRDTQFRDQLRQSEAALQMAQADARRAEAILSEARTRLERTEVLVERQYQSQQDLQALQAEVASAEAGLEQARARIAQAEANVAEQNEALRRTVVRAPVSGHVGQRNIEVGMRVDPSTRLATIGNLNQVRVRIPIADEMLDRISPGQAALIALSGSEDDLIRGVVSRISPFLQAGSFTAQADIDIDNRDGRLRPGMFVEVDVHYGESQQATLIPLSALYENPKTGRMGVYVASSLGDEVPIELPESAGPDNPPSLSDVTSTEFREITVLARGRETAGIDGVGPGSWVVTVGQNLLNESFEDQPSARIRPMLWTRIAELQRLQDEDLLREFMEKQQQIARENRTSSAADEGGREQFSRTSGS